MNPSTFQNPVPVLVGLGFPATVRSVGEAYKLLSDWPNRDTAHHFAEQACRAALRGDIDAETARGLFVAFAARHDLLGPDMNAGLRATGEIGNDPRETRGDSLTKRLDGAAGTVFNPGS